MDNIDQEIKAVLDKLEQDLGHIYNDAKQVGTRSESSSFENQVGDKWNDAFASIGEKIDPKRYKYSAAYIFNSHEHVANGRISAGTAADIRYFEQHHRSRDLIYNTS